MSVPPNPNPNPIPTPSPNPSGYTHHVHHLGSLQGLHPSFDPKAIPGAPGQGGYHHYDHRLWNRQLQRGGCGTYQRAPVRTKVLWFLLGAGATTILSRRQDNRYNHSHTYLPPSPPPAFSAQPDAPQPQSSWKCKTRISPRTPVPETGKTGMTMMEPITIGQAESKVKGMTREEAIREVFESSSNVTSKDKQLNQLNEVLKGMDGDQLSRLGRIVKEFVV